MPIQNYEIDYTNGTYTKDVVARCTYISYWVY